MSRKSKEEIAAIYKQMQNYICEALEAGDGAGSFKADNWIREEGGGGQTKIFQDGAILEKGGVAFSAVHGPTPKKISDKLRLESGIFFATGVSIVLHPFNPISMTTFLKKLVFCRLVAMILNSFSLPQIVKMNVCVGAMTL